MASNFRLSAEPYAMMVFLKARLVVLSVPKTGTTAYQAALGDKADLLISGPPELKHAPLMRYNRFIRPMFIRVCDVDLDVMAVMREPIDWLGSWWRYRQRPDARGTPTATHDISFDDFVLGYCKGQKPEYSNVGSQAKFMEERPNGVSVTHLFRYSDQEGICAFLKARLQTNFDLPRLNASPERDVILSPKVETRLRERCAQEFALYDSIGRQCPNEAACEPSQPSH